MSLTLKEAISATQTTIDVNGTDALSNGDLYTIEDEQVFIVTAAAGDIQPGQTAWQRLNVQRGQLGTTEVGHTAGTAVTLVETPLGAGVQTIRLLGPWPFAYNTPLLMNPINFGADVGIVPAGSTFQGFVTLTTGFNQPGELTVNASVNGTDGSIITVAVYNGNVVANNTSGDEIRGDLLHAANGPLSWAVTDIDAHIVVGFYPDAVAPTTGAGHLYVLIAEPAA